MQSVTPREKATLFGDLHRGPKILVLPNAWDAASARIFEVAGFPAMGTTSAGIAASLGYADGSVISRQEMLDVVARIAAAVAVPVTADMESGYGDPVATAKAVVEAGAIGINLEDIIPGREDTSPAWTPKQPSCARFEPPTYRSSSTRGQTFTSQALATLRPDSSAPWTV